MKRSLSLVWVRLVALMLVLLGAAAPVLAVPVLGIDDQGSAIETAVGSIPQGRALPAARFGGSPGSMAPEASTGNKNLDLLLELQGQASDSDLLAGKAGAAAVSPTPASAAAANAAAKALAALRAKAAQQPPAEDLRARPALPAVGGLGLLDEEARRAKPAERREWVDQMGDRDGQFDRSRESGFRDHGDSALLDLPRQVIAYLRDNRYWVLGSIGFLVLLGFALKAYSRRI